MLTTVGGERLTTTDITGMFFSEDLQKVAVLHELFMSEYNFVLTGSCADAYPDNKSGISPHDVDFFVREIPELRKFLLSQGFQRVFAGGYADITLSCVYYHPAGIHVQTILPERFEKKLLVMWEYHMICRMFLLYPTKGEREILLESMFRLAR